jgi:peptide-methionine (R)-S-oxide reductase
MNKDELKAKLSDEEYRVTQEKGTEAPFTGAYWNEHNKGMYACKVCGNELFSSDRKFDSGTGWPSFDDAIPGATRSLIDTSHGMTRTEVTCANCGAHLGHVFEDGPKETTCKRFCINSASLEMKKE